MYLKLISLLEHAFLLARGTTRSNVSQKVQGKYSPSKRTVLYGCAAASIYDACKRSTLAELEFEWREVNHLLENLVSVALYAHN